ncbi:hypothetical protein MKEN_00500400 [Mycena kentingensis (nom. inval.)]|nr:hypothetical protein MKEN_00500400 [Mycena kentingensis (nom. inval.)]
MAPPLLGDADGKYRVHIVGNSGSGKVGRDSRDLDPDCAAIPGVPFISLDTLHWNPGWRESCADEMRKRIQETLVACPHGWVIDGNYTRKGGDLVESSATDRVWLDPPLALYLPRLILRTLKRGRYTEARNSKPTQLNQNPKPNQKNNNPTRAPSSASRNDAFRAPIRHRAMRRLRLRFPCATNLSAPQSGARVGDRCAATVSRVLTGRSPSKAPSMSASPAETRRLGCVASNMAFTLIDVPSTTSQRPSSSLYELVALSTAQITLHPCWPRMQTSQNFGKPAVWRISTCARVARSSTFKRLFRLGEPCSPGCDERFTEVFFSKDSSIIWWCISHHSIVRRREREHFARIGIDVGTDVAGRKMRRIGGWGGELRGWLDAVRVLVRSR